MPILLLLLLPARHDRSAFQGEVSLICKNQSATRILAGVDGISVVVE